MLSLRARLNVLFSSTLTLFLGRLRALDGWELSPPVSGRPGGLPSSSGTLSRPSQVSSRLTLNGSLSSRDMGRKLDLRLRICCKLRLELIDLARWLSW